MRSILISDLHLSPNRPDITRAFNQFLAGFPEDVGELFILGDLFEIWLGDDDPSHFSQAVIETIRLLSRSGVRTYFQAGNRDFLVGTRFSKETGCKILPEFCVQNIRNHKILLTHGDLLCTDDHEYQKFRRRIQSPLSLWTLNHLPFRTRQRIAAKVWSVSKEATQHKSEEIMDVNEDEVLSKLIEFNVDTMIHGHTHRPAVHSVQQESGKAATRYTLGDWDTNLWWIEVNAEGIELKSLPIDHTVKWNA